MGEAEQLEQSNQPDESSTPSEENEVEVVLLTEEGEVEEPIPPKKEKRNPVRDLRTRLKEQKEENTDLAAENATLRQALELAQKGQAPAASEQQQNTATVDDDDLPPTLESVGYDTEEYQRKYAAWNQRQLNKLTRQADTVRTEQSAAQAKAQQNDEAITKHYQRANELKVVDYEETEDALVGVMGAQLVQAIQTTVDNSEFLIYHLGKNPEKAQELTKLFESSPGRATVELGRLSSRLTIRQRNGSAPDPEVPVHGGGGALATAATAKWQKKLDAEYAKGDLDGARKVRAEASAAGVELPYNRA